MAPIWVSILRSSSIIYGRLSAKVGTKKMLMMGVFAYTCITLFAAFEQIYEFNKREWF